MMNAAQVEDAKNYWDLVYLTPDAEEAQTGRGRNDSEELEPQVTLY